MGQIEQGGYLMTLVKKWTIFIIQDDNYNSVNNHRKTRKKINICPKFKREGGALKAGQMSQFLMSEIA